MAKFFEKSRIIILTLMLALSVSALFSCAVPESNGGTGGGNGNTGVDVPLGTAGLIYNSQTEINLIAADSSFPETKANNIAAAFRRTLGNRAHINFTDDIEALEHEIILGESNRDVSRTAYAYLDQIMESYHEEHGGYVLYSDGSSLALAYTDEVTNHHLEDVIADLLAMAEQTSLVYEEGIVSTKIYDLYKIYEQEDKERQDAAFALLEEQTNAEVAAAVKELYQQAFDDDVISWLANLYEPRSCICDNYVDGVQVCLHPTDINGNYLCSNGGFYYSNSARNTYGYLPDVESTYQALVFLEMTGMLAEHEDSFGVFLDGQFKSDIVAFVKGLQIENGYFYHPQWTVEATNENWERVSRDLMWSVAILQKTGERPYYTTPTGSLTGTGKPKATSSMLTGRLGISQVLAVSRVVATADVLPAHLQSVSAFEQYLAKKKLDVFGTGYAAANELAASVDQLVAANKKLNGALKPVLFNWFEAKHNPKNGLWRDETDYDGLNTAFKALMVYSAFKMPFTYAEQAAESAIYVLSSGEKPGHVCGVYNTWYDIAGLVGNIRAYHPDVENRELYANQILEKVREIAPTAIRNTIKNTLIFRKSDATNSGSFSYFEDHCSETSQGMPVAVRRNEGDVNASLICTGGLIDHISKALGVDLPPIFGTRQLAEFMDIINANTYSLKDVLPDDEPADFDEEVVGEKTALVGTAVSSGGSALVDVDPKNSDNQVLHFQSLAKSGAWDAVTIKNNSVKRDNNCLVFEGKFMFCKEGTYNGSTVQFYIGTMGKPSPYFINFLILGDYVEVWEASSDNSANSFDRLLGKFKLDEWFKLRIEYYMGYEDVENGLTPHDTVRIKVYTNNELVAVSANYMDTSMKKFLEGVGAPVDEASSALFFPMTYLDCNVYFDDLYLGYKTIPYQSENGTEGLIINEDSNCERKIYNFDDNAAPEDFTITSASRFSFSDGVLKLLAGSGTGTITVPTLQTKPLSNVFALGFTIQVDQAKTGDVLTINFKDPHRNKTVSSYTMKCVQTDSGLALVPVYKGTTMLNSAAIPVGDGKAHTLEFAFFVDAATTLIYKDGKMMAATEQDVIAKCYLYEVGSAVISYSGSVTASVDNLFCERRVGDFDEEVKPSVDRITYTFKDGELKDLTTDGSVADGKLSLAGGRSLTIPANNRSAYISAYQLYADIDASGFKANDSTRVAFVDGNGTIIAAIDMVASNGKLLFYEVVNGGRLSSYVASCEYDDSFSLMINLFSGEKAVEIYVDGEVALVTSIFNATEYGNVDSVKITSKSGVFDNMYLDGITLTYTAPKVDKTTQDDTDSVITYEYSSLGNYPDRVTAPNNITQNSNIQYVERDGNNSKVLVYKKVLENYPSGVRFKFADGTAKSKLVFETDMKLAGTLAAGTWRSQYDLYFANSTGGTHIYIIQFYVESVEESGVKKKHLYMRMNNGNELEKRDCGEIPEDGWFNIRVELDVGDKTTNEQTGSTLKFYYNDKLIYSGNDFVGSGTEGAKASLGSVTQIMLIPNTASTGTIYFDNTVIEPAK